MAGTITHKWNGTILTVTSDSGSSSCDLKGAQGDMGIRGPQGAPGILTDPTGMVLADANNYYLKEEVDDIAREVTASANEETAALDTRVTNELITRDATIDAHNKRITNLEHWLAPRYFETDSTIAYKKDVPEGALPYAEVTRVGGMSYKSKNFFIPSQVSKTALGLTMSYYNGYIKINGTKGSGANVQSVTFPNITLPAGTYIVSCRMVGGSITNTPENFLGVYFGINQNTYSLRTTPAVAKVGDIGTRVITLSEPTKITSFDITPDYDGTGAIFNNALFEMQFEAGNTVTAYQEGFDGLRDSKVTELKSVGANVLNIEGNEFGSGKWFRTMNNGLTISSFSAGKYTFTSKDNYLNITAYDSSGYHWLSRFVELEPNTNYRLTVSGLSCIIVGLADNAVNTVGKQLTVTNKVFNSGNYKYWMISFYSTGAGNVMISKGEQEQGFVPYKEITLSIPAAVQALEGYGLGVNADYHNYINWDPDNNVKTWNVQVKKKVLDGSENWSRNSYFTAGNGYTLAAEALPDYKANTLQGVCSHFDIKNSSATLTSGIVFGSRLNIVTPTDMSLSDSTVFKAWIGAQYAAGTPVVIDYIIATPEVTDISNYLSDDNFIDVEGNGTITLVNEYSNEVPSEITYQFKEGTV